MTIFNLCPIMELNIELPDDIEISNIISLKDYIEEASIDGLEGVAIERGQQLDNQLGVGDIANTITLIIKAANKPLTELAKCLRDYVATYRTTITIKMPDGREIKIDQGRSFSEENMIKLVELLKYS